jgi:hypothetical protein
MMLDEVSLLLLGCNCSSRFYICLFRAFPVEMATTTQQTLRGLLAVGPDMAKVLVAVALCKASLSSVWLYLDDNIAKAIQLECL